MFSLQIHGSKHTANLSKALPYSGNLWGIFTALKPSDVPFPDDSLHQSACRKFLLNYSFSCRKSVLVACLSKVVWRCSFDMPKSPAHPKQSHNLPSLWPEQKEKTLGTRKTLGRWEVPRFGAEHYVGSDSSSAFTKYVNQENQRHVSSALKIHTITIPLPGSLCLSCTIIKWEQLLILLHRFVVKSSYKKLHGKHTLRLHRGNTQ